MGYGDAVVRRHGNCRSDPRHYFKGDIMGRKQLQFFAASSEQEGVAALQAHDLVAGKRFVEQHLRDLLL